MDLDSESPPDIAFDSQGPSRAQSHLFSNHQQLHHAARAAAAAEGHRPKKSPSTCGTCRMRKVRCNGTRPLCSNCQRLGFPCSYDDVEADAWSVALPRRRVRQACLSCHSRKARCSGHLPACERCRAHGLECVYRPSKRARTSARGSFGDVASPQSRQGGADKDRTRDDAQNDSDAALTDHPGTATPSTFNLDVQVFPTPALCFHRHGTFSADPYYQRLPRRVL